MKQITLTTILAMLLLFSCTERNVQEAKVETATAAIAVHVQKLSTHEVVFAKTHFGRLKYARTTTYVAELAGRIENLRLRTGQRVKKGQRLVSFPPAKHHFQVAQLQLAVDDLRRSYERQKELKESGAVSKASVEDIKTQLDIQSKALAQLRSVNEITAPYSGVITEVFVTEGQEVMPGEAVFSMADTEKMEAELFISVKDISRLSLGDKVMLSNKDGDQISGVVSQKSVQMDMRRHAFRVLVSFKGDTLDRVAGELVELEIPYKTMSEAILIPEQAIQRKSGKEYVYLAKNGMAKQAPIKTGRRKGLNTIIEEGLKAGDVLVVGGIEKLADGTLIKIAE